MNNQQPKTYELGIVAQGDFGSQTVFHTRLSNSWYVRLVILHSDSLAAIRKSVFAMVNFFKKN